MTAPEACGLLVNATREISAARTAGESWRLLALVALHHVADLTRELEMVEQRQYVHRTRTQDKRDVFLDQCDLRREAA